MKEALETHKLGNKTLEIHLSTHEESPREGNNCSTLILTDGCGDKTDFSFSGGYSSRQDFVEQGEIEIRKHFKDVAVCLSVNRYSHSGTGYSTSNEYPYNCQWDSGTVGFIVITKAQIREHLGITRITKSVIDTIEKFASGEVDTFSQWASGDVYGFVLKEDGEETDSCWGFYGMDIKTNGILDHIGEEWKEVA
jgi:hypothetical protein|tara:strand:- start:2066 stop:2647 length:582 start_codon:yes stop_codon:yes gene_type:complete